MTIATGQIVSVSDLNGLYTNSLNKLRTLQRSQESTYIWNYRFTNIDAGTTTLTGGAKSLVQQTVEFTPPTDMNLKTFAMNVTNSSATDTYTVTLTGSTLLEPITLSRSVSSGLTSPQTYLYAFPYGGVISAGTYSLYKNVYHTLFAGATYKISVVNTGLAATNFVNIEVATTNGYRR